MREKLGKLLNHLKSKREDKIINLYQTYYSDSLFPEQARELDKKYWLALNYGVDPDDHADIENYCISFAEDMEEKTSEYLWFYISRYFLEIMRWKFQAFLNKT